MPRTRQTIKAGAPVVLRRSPVRLNRALLFQPQQYRVESALVNEELVAADLLDPPGNAVPYWGPSTSSVFSTIRASVPGCTSFLVFMNIWHHHI